MKKKHAFLLCILLFSLLISLSSCVIIPRYMTYDIDAETVSSAEIHQLGKEDYLPSEETLIQTIEGDQLEDFLSDLSDIRFSDIIIFPAAMDPSFAFGTWVVRINYTDGSYALISDRGYGETYDENDSRTDLNHFDCDNDKWNQFIKDYLPKKPYKKPKEES